MDPTDLNLAIHHHHTAHLDSEGHIWLSSVLGRWIEALASNLGQVTLLLFQSKVKLPEHDTMILQPNVTLTSLGPPLLFRHRRVRSRNIQQACEQANQTVNSFIIRGITPRQYEIWRSIRIPRKAALLVGSLQLSYPESFSARGILAFFLAHQRRRELGIIAKTKTVFLANSPGLVNEIEKKYHRQAYFTPTNSIRRSEFAEFQVREVSQPQKLLYCGRIDLKKGLRELFQAMAILNQEQFPCCLEVIGSTETGAYAHLVDLAQKLGISSQVRWRGRIPYGSELLSFYRHADIFVLPSYNEGFPHVIWEAAANCCPVVATAVGGIPALWEHERHGLLVPPMDAKALAVALRRMLVEEELRETLVTHAYQLATGFTAETCAQKLVNILAMEWNQSDAE